jgi:chemotaxis protein CheX
MQAEKTGTPTPRGPSSTINPKLIVPFVNSVRHVFKTMVNVESTINPPRLKANPCPSYDVSGIIGFSGDVVGSVVVSLQMAAAKSLVAAFAGMPIEPGTPDFVDAIGELTNMIAGGAKKHLGNAANITVPSVIIGQGHQIARLSDVPCIVIPCTTAAGDFAVEVSIKQVNQ